MEVFQKERNITEALNAYYGSSLSAGNLPSSGGSSQANKQKKSHCSSLHRAKGNPLDMNLSKVWEIEKDKGAWHAAIHGISKSRT